MRKKIKRQTVNLTYHHDHGILERKGHHQLDAYDPNYSIYKIITHSVNQQVE
jgi:hypothetical protein